MTSPRCRACIPGIVIVAALGCARIGVPNVGVVGSSRGGDRKMVLCVLSGCCRDPSGGKGSAWRGGELGIGTVVCSSVVVRGAEGFRNPFPLTPCGETLRTEDVDVSERMDGVRDGDLDERTSPTRSMPGISIGREPLPLSLLPLLTVPKRSLSRSSTFLLKSA